MIGFYKMSLQGLSHIKDNIECQDYSDVIKLNNNWVVGAIADGLGSAKHSAIGAKLATESIFNFLKTHISDISDFEEKTLTSYLKVAFIEAQKAIIKKAKQEANTISDYDTTLTVVVYNGISPVRLY